MWNEKQTKNWPWQNWLDNGIIYRETFYFQIQIMTKCAKSAMQTTCKPSGENISTSTMHFPVQSHIRALHSTLRWWHFSISVTWTWIQVQPPLQVPLLMRRLPKVDVWESFMVSIKSFDLCGLQHARLWSRSMPRLTVHLEMAYSDSEGRML